MKALRHFILLLLVRVLKALRVKMAFQERESFTRVAGRIAGKCLAIEIELKNGKQCLKRKSRRKKMLKGNAKRSV